MKKTYKFETKKQRIEVNIDITPKREPLPEEAAYIELNNLYLALESGKEKMSITNRNKLEVLLDEAYPDHCETLINWWYEEFYKLPDFFNY